MKKPTKVPTRTAGELTVRHVFFELLELRPRPLDSLLRPLDCVLRPLDSVLRATLLDRVDDQEGEDEHEEYAFNRQLKSSKLHR